jgi:hypothetical protein
MNKPRRSRGGARDMELATTWTEGGFMMNLPEGLTLAENTIQRKNYLHSIALSFFCSD